MAGAVAILAPAALAATVDVGWTAAGETDGALTSWSASTNTYAAVAQWNGTGTKASGATNLANVNDWVNAPDYNFTGGSGDSWQDRFGDAGTTKVNASWELVLRPGSFTGNRHIFNTGGNGDGTAFLIENSTIRFIFQDANSPDNRVALSFDLGTVGTANDFFHIVGTSDIQSAAAGTGELWVNGSSVASQTSSLTIADWDGGDLASLGSSAENHNIPSANPYVSAAFTGDIAIFNFYSGEVLGETDVQAAYNALVPEPSSLALLGLGGLLIARRRRGI